MLYASSLTIGCASSRRYGSRWLTLSILLLLSTSSIGCQLWQPDPKPVPAPLPQSTCRDGNAEEWAGFNAIVQVALKQRELGDEYHFAAATEWLGSILLACFPERFQRVKPEAVGPADDPDPVSSEERGKPPGAQ